MKIDSIKIEQYGSGKRELDFFLQEAEPGTISCKKHIHSTVELLYINEGDYHVTLDDEEFDVSAGDLVLFTSNAIHHVTAGVSEKNSYYVMKIPQTLLFSLAERESAYEYVMRFAIKRSDSRYLWRRSELSGTRMEKTLQGLVTEFKSDGYAKDLSLHIGMASLLVEILRDTPPKNEATSKRSLEQILRVMDHVRTHYAEDIDERELAAGVGMSYSYFSRSFKRVTGLSLREYLNRTRIARADQMLFNGDSSISEIATLCGYNSVSYFISVYKKQIGKPPKRILKSKEK